VIYYWRGEGDYTLAEDLVCIRAQFVYSVRAYKSSVHLSIDSVSRDNRILLSHLKASHHVPTPPQ
jgi:hypothetical protein